MGVLIAPSLLSADFTKLGEDIAAVERGGADMLHVDVMDGHFVPNLSIGPPVVRAIHRVATIPLDVHLMLDNPDDYLTAFIDAGASRITVHVEVLPHLHRTLQVLRNAGVKAGVAINPSTPVVALEEIAADVDQVLLMSVNPGFGGQKFIPQSLDKVKRLRQLIVDRQLDVRIEIDGGIDRTNIEAVVAAGAEMIVAGSAIFGTPDAEAAVKELRNATVQWV